MYNGMILDALKWFFVIMFYYHIGIPIVANWLDAYPEPGIVITIFDYRLHVPMNSMILVDD